MSLQLFYSKRCPKSREILTDILNSGVRPHFVLISIDKHLNTKRRMPKGVRITPTVHRETSTQIHVYEGDDIKALIKQMASPVGGHVGNDYITSSVQPQQNNNPVMAPPDKNKYKQETKSTIMEDESWKNGGSLEIADTGQYRNTDPKSLEAERAEFDNRIKQQLEAQKNDPNLQKWIQGEEVK